MTTPLLVVSPLPNLGALLKKGLDASQFEVFATSDFSEAIHYLRRSNSPIALLDGELEDIDLSVRDICFALQQIKADVQFVLIRRPQQEINSGELTFAATFTKPLLVPALQERLQQMLTRPTAAPLPASPKVEKAPRSLAETSRMVWITDVSRAAQHLTRLTLESSAQAALITRENELWAYAGQLSREAAQELSQSINRYWDRENDSDLLRFIRLQATEAQHVLYARKLSASMILALVFDGETPFSTIRSQANKLIKNLTETPPDIAPNASGNLPPFLPLTEDPALPSPEEDLLPTFSDLLGEVPPPVPSGRSALPMPWEVPAPNFRSATDEPVTAPPHQLEAPSNPIPVFSQESSPPIRRDTLRRHIPAMDETLAAKMQEVETLSRPLPAMDETDSLNLPEDLAVTRKQTVKDPSLMETRRQNVAESVTQVAHRILLEPASPAMANLAYACLLVPRFDTHHLIGDAADRLNSWVPQVCIAFGWRLEYIAVRPDYLQWVLRVPPSTAPGYIMRIIRQQTSEKLFADFPRYAKDNPSKDFWAPGYLIMGSSEPHPQKLVRDFIRSTRERQGLGIE